MDQFEGEEKTYLSCDTVCKAATLNGETDMLYQTKFLNSLHSMESQIYRLKLKVHLPVMLLCNINQSGGLCNGTRMTIIQLGRRFIKAQIIRGAQVGEKVYITRITMPPTESAWPFIPKRRQYPISV
jgi:ATP-dependent DNA helicase PIF1